MISIVTGTLNRLKYLPGLIANTVNACPLLELVLVDGGSTDGTLDYLRGLGHPRVRLVEVGGRSSYAHFMNLGIRAATHEYVCQWNDDVLLANSWDEVIAELDTDHDIYLFNWKGGSAESIHDPAWMAGEDKEHGWQLINQKPDGEIVVNYGIYTKRVFRAVGMYNTAFYHYCADGDMADRAWTFGFKEKNLRHIKVATITQWAEKQAVYRAGADEEIYRQQRELYKDGIIPHSVEFLLEEKPTSKLSVLVFSKDRPLFLKTCLESMRESQFDVTVLCRITTTGKESQDDYRKAYAEVQKTFPEVKFIIQESVDIRPYMREWLTTASEFVMVTVDDNVFTGKIDSTAIRQTMAKPEVFGFTLRLAPGIRHTQDGKTATSTPEGTDAVIEFEPAKYQCPWDYVWEMSSTFYRRQDMLRVVESSAMRNPNDLEMAGLRLFNASTAKRMGCFRYAPATNVFVDSWASPQCVTCHVSDAMALRLFHDGQEIDVSRTFRERDLKGVTHVKRIFLKPKAVTNSAIVVIPTRNTEKWTENCIQSVMTQTYKDLGLVFVDDCSDDATFDVASKLLIGRANTVLVSRAERTYSLANIDFAIRECCSSPESVIFLLDGDDWLATPTAIEEMMEQQKTADVVWSKYQNTDGYACCCGPLTGNDIRNHIWVTSHLRSFKKFLFDAIKAEDFTDEDGKFYRMTGDQAVMLPILEQVPPERRRFYDKVLYIYNRDNPGNDDKVSRAEQKRCEVRIRAQKPYGLNVRYLPQEERPSISVIISSFNQLGTLKLSLDSMNFQTAQPKEVIIADDGSTDGTIEWLETIGPDRYTFPVSYTTRRHEGYRLASVNGEAARRATGKRILFTNADVVHCPASIHTHLRVDDNTIGAGVVRCIAPEGAALVNTALLAGFAKVIELAENYPSGRTNLKFRQYDPRWCHVAVWGGNFSVARKMLEKIGWFDEGYTGWGGEDADVTKRCINNGGTAVWLDDSLALHLDHPVRTYSYRQLGSMKFNSGR